MPEYCVVSAPDCELPDFSANFVRASFFSIAVTKLKLTGVLSRFEPLPMNRPFSRSASTHGPEPVHGPKKHVVLRLTESMWPLPVSLVLVSALP